MIGRRAFLGTIAGALVGAPRATPAQSPATRVYRIGFLGAEAVTYGDYRMEILRNGLLDAGYVEGRNVVVDTRYTEGHYDRLPRLASELVQLNVDVIVASGSKAGIAAKGVTTTTPIVVDNMGDAVRAGFAPSYGQPGGNVTGISMLNPEVTTKQLGLLKEIKPRTTVVAVLMNPANPNYDLTLRALEREAGALKVRVEPFDVRSSGELESTFAAVALAGIDAIDVQSETLFGTNAKAIADLALKHRIALAGRIDYARVGGLVGYSADGRETWRRVAIYVDKILKGTRPSELPIEQPTRILLLINVKTAEALGLTIPQSLLLRADEVIR